MEDFAKALTSAQWRVDGQMRIFLVDLCRGIEKLRGDVLCLNRRSEVRTVNIILRALRVLKNSPPCTLSAVVSLQI